MASLSSWSSVFASSSTSPPALRAPAVPAPAGLPVAPAPALLGGSTTSRRSVRPAIEDAAREESALPPCMPGVTLAGGEGSSTSSSPPPAPMRTRTDRDTPGDLSPLRGGLEREKLCGRGLQDGHSPPIPWAATRCPLSGDAISVEPSGRDVDETQAGNSRMEWQRHGDHVAQVGASWPQIALIHAAWVVRFAREGRVALSWNEQSLCEQVVTLRLPSAPVLCPCAGLRDFRIRRGRGGVPSRGNERLCQTPGRDRYGAAARRPWMQAGRNRSRSVDSSFSRHRLAREAQVEQRMVQP